MAIVALGFGTVKEQAVDRPWHPYPHVDGIQSVANRVQGEPDRHMRQEIIWRHLRIFLFAFCHIIVLCV